MFTKSLLNISVVANQRCSQSAWETALRNPRISATKCLHRKHPLEVDDGVFHGFFNISEFWNAYHNTVKCNWRYSITKINSLNVTMKKDYHRLITHLYRKRTDKRQLLCDNSYHPKLQENNLGYSQFLHLPKIRSKNFDLERDTISLKRVSHRMQISNTHPWWRHKASIHSRQKWPFAR